MNELDIYRFDFKKTWFGGYDRLDVLNKVKDLNERYQGIMQNQKEYYESKINELEEKIGSGVNNNNIQMINSINDEEKKRLQDELLRQRIHYENLINDITSKRIDINQNLLDEQKKKYEDALDKMNNMYDEKIDEYQDRIENVVSFTLELIGKKVDEINSENVIFEKSELDNLMSLKKEIEDLKSKSINAMNASSITNMVNENISNDSIADYKKISDNEEKDLDDDDLEFSKMTSIDDGEDDEVEERSKRGRKKKTDSKKKTKSEEKEKKLFIKKKKTDETDD